MAYLSHKEFCPSVTSSTSLFNAENVDLSSKQGYYEQFYPQKSLSGTIHFQIYSSEDYFMDFTSTFIHLLVVVRKSKNEKQSAAEELSYENCVLNNLFRQIRVYINGAYGGIKITLPNIARYIQFMSYLKLGGLVTG